MNIFDLLDTDLNFVEEYNKLMKLFKNKIVYRSTIRNYTLKDLFNEKLKYWDYRGTAIYVDDILKKLKLGDITDEKNSKDDLLKLIQLLLNVRKLIYEYYNSYELDDIIIFDNIKYILEKVKYKSYNEKDKIILAPQNIETLSAVNSIDKSLGTLLVEYLDFNIQKDINEKKRILNDISYQLEPTRNELNKVNKNITDKLFHLFNKMNIRHNNREGKNRIEEVANMKDEEIISWYDKTYEMTIYLLNQEKNVKNVHEIEELIRKIEEKNN